MLTAALFAILAAAPPARAESIIPERSTAPIVVVWPPEGMAMPPGADHEFIFGNVADEKAAFSINGQTVSVHPNGAFLAWVPISPGTFTFLCSLDLKEGATTYARSISVLKPPEPLLHKPRALDAETAAPRLDVELRPGDLLALRVRASPGHKAAWRLGKQDWQPLRESSAGVYESSWAVGPGAESKAAAVEYRLEAGWSSPKVKSRGTVSLSSGAPLVAVTRSSATLKTGPGNGYVAFLPPGVKLVTAGRVGPEVKVALSRAQDAWVEAKDIEFLAAGTLPPRAVVGAINVAAFEDGSNLRIGVSDRVAFNVEQSRDRASLTLRLFQATGHTNWIIYDSNDAFVKEVRWRQEASDVVAVTVALDKPLWGWQAAYEGGSLKLELRRPPKLAGPPASPLAGLTILLDPGHMPSAPGATGPMGAKELDANYAIAKAVEALLLKEKAEPVLSRPTPDAEVSLGDRPRLAVERKADLFVSLHNNALPDGENPFARPRGFSVFYYHPQSLELARALYDSYKKRSPLPGEELRYGNLLVARLSAMPAVLIENAYIILPEQELLLSDPEFRELLAQAVVDGLRDFLLPEQARQYPPPAKPAAERSARKSKKK